MSGLANKTPNSANVARINTTPVKSPNQKIAYMATMTTILSVMLSTPNTTYSYVFLAVGTTLIAGGPVNGDGPPTKVTNSIYWTACKRWAPTARVLDHLFDHEEEKEGIYHVMIGTRKCHLIDLATVDLPFFSTVSSNLFDVSTYMVDAGGQAFASWRGKLLKAIEAHVDTSPGVPISETLSACFVFVLFHAAIVRGDSNKSSKCIKSINAILNKTKNWGVIFVSSACVKFATVDLNGESTYVVVDDMLHLLGYAENSLRKGLMAVQQEVKEVKQELKEVKQEFKEVKQEVKQVKQDVGLLKSLISIVSNVLFWLVAFVFYIKKRLVGDIGALQANVEATAAKVEEASKQQDQKNKALVQLSTNAAKKALA